MAQKTTRNEGRWADRISRSGFFLGALLFHLILFLMVATWIVFRPPPPQPELGTVFVPPAPSHPLPPPQSPVDVSIINPSPSPHVPEVPIVSPHDQDFKIKVPSIDTAMATNHDPKPLTPAQIHADPLALRLKEIEKTVELYRKDDPKITDGHVDGLVATFPVYVASYANGDWACNLRLDKAGNIVAGSVPDLVAKINEWSHGRIKGQVVPKPLNIGGPELMDKRPPFIFFTGHKDFVLTEQEIQNLRAYLNVGGAIWGDNALAGEGSRFDVAFKREMKRVLPDPDKNFVPYTLADNIFTKSYFPITQIPTGMNYYAEPPEHLDIDGILAILYTPNDYSDLMFMRVLPGDKEVYVPNDPPPHTLFTERDFWSHRDVFYRNFDLSSALAVDRLGMNVVAYLLVRFDDKLLLTP